MEFGVWRWAVRSLITRRLPFSSSFPWAQRRLTGIRNNSSLRPDPRERGVYPDKQPPRYDPFAYTSGRWLHRDELERNSRHVQFNFSALCERVISLCPGAANITDHEKKEGGFNKVFIFTMDTGSRVVARIPTRIAGPPRLTTNSEVATITYLQSKLSLPTPKILDWKDTPSNPIGAEYIIQEHVEGVELYHKWHDMTPEQHMLCTKALSLTIKKMASLDFPSYGSLYFLDAPLESSQKIPLEDGFCIRPHCSPVFWNCNPGELELYGGPSPDCGPWENLQDYYCGLVQSGSSRIPRKGTANVEQRPHQGSIQDHIDLLRTSEKVMQRLVEDERIQNAAAPVLSHPDYHKRNIYVSDEDPTVITGLIDWQSASVEPAFIYSNETPDFAALPEIPEEDTPEEANPEASGQKEREVKDAMICHQTYDIAMTGLVPKMRPARLLDPTLFRIFHYCHTSWRDSAAAVRQELIELSTRWTELELQGPCPYSPTQEELSQHAQDYEDFEVYQRLKLWLKDSLYTNSDGWVPNEIWDAAKDAHREAYDEWIQTARESEARREMTVAKAEKLWPFDSR